MANAGMEIGSHSRSHPHLGKIQDADVLRDEILGSKKTLEAELSVPINEFAYPYGSYNAAAVAMVESAGYKAARASNFGIRHSQNETFRLSAITAPGDLATFERILSTQTALVSGANLCISDDRDNNRTAC
jgi:peptidoglycan/xylan/chitin deacetylase (PgdA/CDA1 family)